jgi:hypothetical protein
VKEVISSKKEIQEFLESCTQIKAIEEEEREEEE